MTKALAYSLVLILATLLVLMLRSSLEAGLSAFFGNTFTREHIISACLRLLLITGLAGFAIQKGFLPFNGLSPRFSVSNLPLLLIAVVVILLLAYSSYPFYLEAPPLKLTLFGIGQALVGILEELLFRGLVLPLLIIHYAHTKRPIFNAVCLSSLLFGLVHLSGLVRNPGNIWGVANTVIFATGIGFLMACVLLRTRNILVPAFIHFLIDFTNAASELSEEIVTPAPPAQSTILLTLAVVIVMALIFIGAGMFLFRRVQQEEWLHKASLIRL